METIDIAIVGAGVVGLAIARALALTGRQVLILEAAASFGTETSSRNSEVIHAGIYYPRGSLKARLCVAGRDLLYRYCEGSGVEHRRCGKLIVATDESQGGELATLRRRAADNGVELELLSATQARALEPELQCVAALHSPLTGIVDSHGLMLALLGQAEERGATLVCKSRVTQLRLDEAGVAIGINGAAPELAARLLINSAGLQAPQLARSIAGFPAAQVPRAYFAKGSYFQLAGRTPFKRLIYPLPEHGGAGVHLTLDIGGRARFGPDVQWVDDCDYRVDPRRAQAFYAAVRRYWPALPDDSLLPGYTGIRPKISGPGQAAADFRIDGPSQHGGAPVINLFGIESPGLTASLAIGREVAGIARDHLQ